MWAFVHSLLHDQAAWHGARIGDCAVGGQRSRRQDFRRKHERKRGDVSHGITVRTTTMADCTKLTVSMERRPSSPRHDAACVGGGPARAPPAPSPFLYQHNGRFLKRRKPWREKPTSSSSLTKPKNLPRCLA